MNERMIRRRLRLFSLLPMFLVLCVSAESQQLAKTEKAPGDSKTTESAQEKQLQPLTEYTVGEGDVLHVNVWQESEVSQNVVVRPDGNISLPLINEVKVSGMTVLKMQDLIADKLKTFVNTPKVTVTVLEIHSKKAFITGEVAHPGDYPLNTHVTVLQLIAQAGGFTPFAKTENIVVLRVVNGTQQRLRFKYKEVVEGKNTQQNIALQPGDTVIVP